MTEIQAIHAVQAGFFLVAFVVFWHFCWRKWALDHLRQELFAIRDHLFDVALASESKGFGFNHPGYGHLRLRLNASIRFAHHVSTLQVMVFRALSYFVDPDGATAEPTIATKVCGLLKEVDPSVQEEVEAIIDRYGQQIIRLLALTSPLFYLTLAYFIAVGVKESVLQKVSRERDALQRACANYSSAVWAEAGIEEELNDARRESSSTGDLSLA